MYVLEFLYLSFPPKSKPVILPWQWAWGRQHPRKPPLISTSPGLHSCIVLVSGIIGVATEYSRSDGMSLLWLDGQSLSLASVLWGKPAATLWACLWICHMVWTLKWSFSSIWTFRWLQLWATGELSRRETLNQNHLPKLLQDFWPSETVWDSKSLLF